MTTPWEADAAMHDGLAGMGTIGTDKAIRWSTAVIGVTVVAAVVSYEHAYALVHAYGAGRTAHLIPLTVDGLIWASSMFSESREPVAWRRVSRSTESFRNASLRVWFFSSLLF
jgi:hypothetical protein